jgi:hypothetical protein
MKSAQDAVQIIDAQPRMGVDLKSLRGKLVVLATLAEGDPKTPVQMRGDHQRIPLLIRAHGTQKAR